MKDFKGLDDPARFDDTLRFVLEWASPAGRARALVVRFVERCGGRVTL